MFANAVYLTDSQGNPLIGSNGQPVTVAQLPAALGPGGALKVEGSSAAGAADSGNPVKTGGKYNSTLPTLTDGQRGDTQIDDRGRTIVRQARSSTPAQSSVAASASSTSLLAANTSRMGATLYNDSASACNVKLGATASASSFTSRMAAYGYYEVPFSYTGAIDGIWDSATGNMRITELT